MKRHKRIKKYAGHFADGLMSVFDISGTVSMRDIRQKIHELDDSQSIFEDVSSLANDFNKVMPIFSDEMNKFMHEQKSQSTVSSASI